MMKLHTKLTLGLISSLFAASLATAAGPGTKMGPYHDGMNCNGMGMMSGDMKMDPSARAHKHLSELSAKLNLTADQQPAWKTFSEQVNDQAKNMAAMRDQMKANAQSMPKMTAPERMTKMADWMKDRSDNMAKMVDAVKTFYATLSAEQQATFDKMQMGQMARMR
jgi:hypothetical protein